MVITLGGTCELIGTYKIPYRQAPYRDMPLRDGPKYLVVSAQELRIVYTVPLVDSAVQQAKHQAKQFRLSARLFGC